MEPILAMKNIVKRFPGVLANDHVSLEVMPGEIRGLLGENGAGKTTLMNILSGLSAPDEGEIWINGEHVSFNNCRDAIDRGIGMVHQHFMLVPVFTVAENIVLGNEPTRMSRLDIQEAERLVTSLSEQYHLNVDPKALIRNIPVGMQQRVEILKALSRGAKILILDEPTAVLTPQEVNELYTVMQALRRMGHTIIFITHKLGEIKAITDQVTVLRDGRTVATSNTQDVEENDLVQMMVGRDVVLHVQKPVSKPGKTVISVEGVSLEELSRPACSEERLIRDQRRGDRWHRRCGRQWAERAGGSAHRFEASSRWSYLAEWRGYILHPNPREDAAWISAHT